MNIAIIGNGECALNSKNGEFIDSCDLVVRLGNFIIQGYEKYIGTKTDIYVARWFKSKSRPSSFFSPLKEIWIPRTYETREENYDNLIKEYNIKNKIKYIPKELTFQYKAQYPFRLIKETVSSRGNKELHCCLPDSGIVAIDMAKYYYNNSKIYIAGYDNCTTGYYWERGITLDNPGADLLELQLKTLQQLIKNNFITDLCNAL